MEALTVIDVNAWTGHWGSLPVRGEAAQVRSALRRIGVGCICLSPLDAVWAHNPHLGNQAVYRAAVRWPDVRPAPLLDPTIPTWRHELACAVEAGAPLVRLVPAYAGLGMADADEALSAVREAGLAVLLQVRVEDPRRQLPVAQVPDTPAAAALDAAQRQPDLRLIIGGAAWRSLMDLSAAMLDLPNVYADTSQADGMDALRLLVDTGLGPRLLFGSHAPLFVPLAGLARILTDLDDHTAQAVLAGNARRALGLQAPSLHAQPSAAPADEES